MSYLLPLTIENFLNNKTSNKINNNLWLQTNSGVFTSPNFLSIFTYFYPKNDQDIFFLWKFWQDHLSEWNFTLISPLFFSFFSRNRLLIDILTCAFWLLFLQLLCILDYLLSFSKFYWLVLDTIRIFTSSQKYVRFSCDSLVILFHALTALLNGQKLGTIILYYFWLFCCLLLYFCLPKYSWQ